MLDLELLVERSLMVTRVQVEELMMKFIPYSEGKMLGRGYSPILMPDSASNKQKGGHQAPQLTLSGPRKLSGLPSKPHFFY